MYKDIGFWLLMLCIVFLGGCSGGDACEVDRDCPLGERCLEGACRTVDTCLTDADCSEPTPLCNPQSKECVACIPSCLGFCCGDDGCGGTCEDQCGSTGQTCSSLLCVCTGVCVPNCDGVECGPDGCGGTCPPGCESWETCDADGQCFGCQPDCQNRECGSDGCGGTCPPGCESWESCDSDGQCVLCEPDCQGRECGPNGCGGSCGECQPGWTCTSAGKCHQDEVDCDELTTTVQGIFRNQVSGVAFNQAETWLNHKRDIDEYEDGCITQVNVSLSYTSGCHLNILAGHRFTHNGGLEVQSVEFSADSFCPGFPDSTEGTYMDLGGLELGEVVLGVHEVPGHNVEESCVITSLTVLMRGELVRSSDGEVLEIDDSELVVTGGHISHGDTSLSCPCQPDCAGKNCGPDGCGDSCGTCPSGQDCNEGVCGCQPDCLGLECGPDGCGGSCGSCPAGQTCYSGQCDCVADCTGKECGDDGCGGSCGTCPTGEACQNHQCTDSPEFECLGSDDPSYHDCLGVSYVGCCDSGRVLWCDNNQLWCIQCTTESPCGWDQEDSYYNCAGDGQDPSGQHPIDCP